MKKVIAIRPLAVTQLAFVYTDFSDLKNLIQFVGSKPTIDEAGNLFFKKMKISDNSVILRDSFGKVVDVIPADKLKDKFEISAESDFKAEHIAKVEVKVVGEKSERSANGGPTRQEIYEALIASGAEFDKRANKAELERVLNSLPAKK